MRRVRVILLAAALLTATAAPVLIAQPANAAVIGVGSGSYRTDRPAGTVGPVNSAGAAVTPKVTARMAGQAPPTNDWWSSLIWQRYAGNPYSENMYAHPLTFHAYANGLGVGYPTAHSISGDGRAYQYIHGNDLTVGIEGLNAPRTAVDGWSDWTVSPLWTDGARTLRTTIGHGSPYVYAEVSGGPARVTFNGPASVFSNTGNVLGVTVNGKNYGLFAPTGSTWALTGTAYAQASAGFFSVAVLPSTGALALYQQYAYSFVTDTRVTWSYANGRANATYTATTTARQGTQTGTLMALYPHQWRYSSDALTAHRYVSPRGEMRVREGSSFSTSSVYNGALPALPVAPDADRARLRSEVDAVLAGSPLPNSDTYWTGKALWRLASVVPIANQIGHTATRDQALTLLRDKLADWYTAGAGDAARLFVYDNAWKTLIGYPASYGSDGELNDHHFHYGYFVLATAIVAQYDPAWASDARFGGMAKLIARDAANWDRGDTRFPFLRNFDPYAGHGWASGHAGFADGNNQESSSEAMLFATGLILLGQATGDTAARDAGIYLYTTERDAIGDYWFNANGGVFPSNYGHRTVGIVWGTGGTYATWWTANPEEIHGINMLPITGGSTYHGAWKPDVVDNVNEIRANNGGIETEWRDIIWNFLATADPAQALSRWLGANPAPEAGESRAHAYHWIGALNAYGTPDHSVTANVGSYAVLTKPAGRTYVAHNPSGSAVTATFSDGQSLAVPARSMAWRGPAGSGTESYGGTSTPGPTLLSQGRPTTASSVENGGTVAANAVDGNAGTRWSSTFSDPQWIQVDLGSPAAISRVLLRWETAYGRAYRIETSPDGQTWTTVFSTTTGDGGVDDLTLTGNGRYVRMYGTQRATGWGYSLWEFEVYGTI